MKFSERKYQILVYISPIFKIIQASSPTYCVKFLHILNYSAAAVNKFRSSRKTFKFDGSFVN